MKKKVIVIIGAARAPGRGLIRAIVEDNGEFGARAVTRDVGGEEGRYLAARGAEVVVGQMGDEASLKEAFQGAYGAFYLLLPEENPFPQKKLAEAEAMARAAKEAGLQHVIWASLEDTTQTSRLQEDEVTPTFLADGRRVANFDAKIETARLFTDLGVPTTCLQATWQSSVATGKWAEEIGKCAYGIFRSRELIGKTVSISAGMLALELARSSAEVPVLPPPKRRAPIVVLAAAIGLVAVVAVAMVRLSDGKKARIPGAVAAIGEVSAVRAKPAPPSSSNAQGQRGPAASTLARVQPEHEPVAPMIMRIAPAGNATRKDAHPKRVSLNVKKRGAQDVQRTVAEETRPSSGSEASPPPPPPEARSAPPEPERQPASERPALPPSARAVERPSAAPPSPGTVPTKAVAAVARTHAPEVQACLERALMDGAELRGRLTVNAVLDPSGRVISVTPSSTIEGGARLQSCVVAAFKSWTFPAPAGGVKGNITTSFSFE